MSGSWKSGILPYERYVFTVEDFLGSYVTDQHYAEQAISVATNPISVLTAMDFRST
jgi:hypothetical protein